jgi:adenine-specific DNA-methyltransferase
MAKKSKEIAVEALKHPDAKRRNIPTAEFETLMREEDKSPVRVAYERRNRDLDPQLVWRGKDEQDAAPLVVQAPPLYIQEKVHPKVLIDDLRRQSQARAEAAADMPDMFADFNGLPSHEAKTEFYKHNANWSNRMILGDSLAVMASLAEREGLRGQVQCIYFDPPYGIKFNSNFQWSTTSRDVKDGNRDHISREPEQVKAFRDTWRDGVHSYLAYLRERLLVARDLLSPRGSLFVQISDENVHRVRCLMDELFGDGNFVAVISNKTSGGSTGVNLPGVIDYVIWYARDVAQLKYRQLFKIKETGGDGAEKYNRVQLENLERRSLLTDPVSLRPIVPPGGKVYRQDNLTSQSVGRDKGEGAASWFPVALEGQVVRPSLRVRWKTNEAGMKRLLSASRIEVTGNTLAYVRYLEDFIAAPLNNLWDDLGGVQSRADPKVYVVQSSVALIQRCVLLASDPGDLILDPTCGSGTTAYVAEQWGRRWITIDTSRVALALARARIMGARYPYYLLADSKEGQQKEGEITHTPPKEAATHGDIRHGFVYERVPHITLKSIANNAEIDVIWEKWQAKLEPLRADLNKALGRTKASPAGVTRGSDAGVKPGHDGMVPWEEWQIPREAEAKWSAKAKELHAAWWQARIARQREIDASIAAKAEFEYLYDKPYTDSSRIRVAGPFTVESLSPHRILAVDESGGLIDGLAAKHDGFDADGTSVQDFATMVLDNLRTTGVQQAHKEDRITFTALTGWPGRYICAEGRFMEGSTERRAAIFLGPEFGTVSRPDLTAAVREAADAGFDLVIACAFNYDAHSSDFERMGRMRVLKARMNPELHMGNELKNTGGGNLFVVFGEPDIRIEKLGKDQIKVRIAGVDVFRPQTGEIESGGPESIALWFIDTDYNEESFFVRHAYFLGANDPYKALKTTLRAEIDEEAWASLHSDTSRPFDKPKSGRIAVKVINHLGDEVMKVFAVK